MEGKKVTLYAAPKVLQDMMRAVTDAEVVASLELEPVQGGTVGAPTVLEAGPEGENRKRIASPGWYTWNGGTVELADDKTWIWWWDGITYVHRETGVVKKGDNGKTIEKYDPLVSYTIGSQVLIANNIWQASNNVEPGESPKTNPEKWGGKPFSDAGNEIETINSVLYENEVLPYSGLLPYRYYNDVDNTSYVTDTTDLTQVNDEESDSFDSIATSSHAAYFNTGIEISLNTVASIEFQIDRMPVTGSLAVGLGVIGDTTLGFGMAQSTTPNSYISSYAPRTQTNLTTALPVLFAVGSIIKVEVEILDTGYTNSKVYLNNDLLFESNSSNPIFPISGNWAILIRGNGKATATKIKLSQRTVAKKNEVAEISKVTVEDSFFSDGQIIENKLQNAPYLFTAYLSNYTVSTMTNNQTVVENIGLNSVSNKSENPDTDMSFISIYGQNWVKDVVRLKFTPKSFKTTNPAIGLGFGNTPDRNLRALMYRMNGQVFTQYTGESGYTATPVLWGARAADPSVSMQLDVEHQIIIDFKNQQAFTKIGAVESDPIDLLDIDPFGVMSIAFRGLMDVNNMSIESYYIDRLPKWRKDVEEAIENIDVKIGGRKRYFNTDICHIIGNGQSLSLGTQSVPEITLVQKYNSLMFKGGLRYRFDNDPIPSDYYSELVPLTERLRAVGNGGETPSSGISESIIELLLKDGVDYFTDNQVQLLFSCPGLGGTSILGLSKGTLHYNDLINEVVQGLARSQELGLTYSVPFIAWTQGETDITNGTTKADYKARLNQLYIDLNTDIKAITGQKNDIVMVMYQTASHNVRTHNNGYTGIAEAQLECALENENIIMANPAYVLSYVSDNVHLTNESSKMLGCQYGVAIKKYLENSDWKPIHVTDYFVQGKIVTLEFEAPVLPLVLDTVNVTNPGNYGFNILDESGNQIAIESVALVRDNTIRIVSSTDILPGQQITYAINGTTTGPVSGARGNLRDSQDFEFDINGTVKKIHNWCPLFRLIV